MLQTALWAAVVPRTVRGLGHSVTVGDLGMLTYALIPAHPKLVLLAPYGTWHPEAEFGRAQFASWVLGHGLSPA